MIMSPVGSTVVPCDVFDGLQCLDDKQVQCCITSPPYWGLRDYGVGGQLGLESTPDLYVASIVAVFREVWRVLRDDGTLWLNLGDSYSMSTRGAGGDGKQYTNSGAVMGDRGWHIGPGLKPKDLVGIPWRAAFALQADGWYLRSDIIWSKPNPMPESVTDRPTKAHEYLFLLTKSRRYYYDADAIREPGAEEGGTHNKRSVWTIMPKPYKGAHFAVMPEKLVDPCILAGSKPGDTVLDPFCGSGTVGAVCKRLGREFFGIDLNPAYCELAERRIADADTLPT